MISFRYHLISVVAIFLALAVGVVVGTTALKGAVVGDLRHQVSDLKANNRTQAGTISGLQNSAAAANALVEAYGGKITAASLTSTAVVIIGAPGTPSSLITAVASAVTTAGGTVSGQLQLTPAFTDPTRANQIVSLATSGAHPVGLTNLPPTQDPGTLAGALLGFVLLGHGQPTDVASVLQGFSSLGMLKPTGTPAPGKAILFVDPGARPTGDSGTAMLASMSVEMSLIGSPGPTIVLGDGAAAGSNGVLGLIRSQDTAKRAVSTVDDIDTPLGQLTAVLVVRDAIAGHKGQYGTLATADALMPGAGP